MSYRLAVFTITPGNRVASQPTFVFVTVDEGQRYLSTIKVFIFIGFSFSLATNELTDPFIETGLLLISLRYAVGTLITNHDLYTFAR
jgi:hypothetical protein